MHPAALQYFIDNDIPPSQVAGWQCDIVERDGEPIGLVIKNGCEVHMAKLDDAPGMTRKNVLAALKPVMDEYGYVTTRVPITETDHKLRQILNFHQTWADDRFTYWAMTTLPWSKKK